MRSCILPYLVFSESEGESVGGTQAQRDHSFGGLANL